MQCSLILTLLLCTFTLSGECSSQVALKRSSGSRHSNHKRFSVPSASFCNGATISSTLTNASEYSITSNRTLYYLPLSLNLTIISYSTEGYPIVCLETHNELPSPVALTVYRALTVMLLGLSMIMLLLSIAHLSQCRSVFGFILLNLAVTVFAADLTATVNAFSHSVLIICILSSIAEHLFLLSQFSWLALLAVNFALRLHRIANSFTSRSPLSIMLLYFCIGWGPSLLVSYITAVVHSLPDSRIHYSQPGFCHLSPVLAAVGLLLLPLLIGWSLAMATVVSILVYLHKLPFYFDNTDKRQFVLMFVLLCVMGAMFSLTAWTVLDRFPLSHLVALFASLVPLTLRSFLLITAFIPKQKLIIKMKTLLQYRNRVSPSPSTLATSSSVSSLPCSKIARQYPAETAELVRLMSDPSQVPKIHTCVRCHDKQISLELSKTEIN